MAAQNAGAYAVADYADQSALAPKAILASVLYDFGGLVKLMIVDAAEGKLDHSEVICVGNARWVWNGSAEPGLAAMIQQDAKEKRKYHERDYSKQNDYPFGALSASGSADKLELSSLVSK